MKTLLCCECGVVIGVYEPIVVIAADGRERTGSRLTLGEELAPADTVALHADCHRACEDGSLEAPADLDHAA
jgi:hypothetical protein